jgi:hypothetical protein
MLMLFGKQVSAVPAQKPVEFDQAISYVNKIKACTCHNTTRVHIGCMAALLLPAL